MTMYPLIKYHAEHAPEDGVVIASAEQDAALGEGWAHSPAEAIDLMQSGTEPAAPKRKRGGGKP